MDRERERESVCKNKARTQKWTKVQSKNYFEAICQKLNAQQ